MLSKAILIESHTLNDAQPGINPHPLEAQVRKADNSAMDRALQEGLELIAAGEYRAVHAGAMELIRRDQQDPVPYHLLGRIAFEHRNYDKAGELLQRARSLAPDNSFFLAALAQYLVTVGKQTEAVKCANSAAALEIRDAYTADTIGVVYSRTGLHEKALPFYETAIALDPAPANFHYNFGAALQFSGRFDDARREYQAVIDREPDAHRAWSALVSLSKQTPDTNYLATLEPLFEAAEGNADAELHYGHAMAKTLEDLGRFEESFDWLVRAKRGKRAEIGYRVATDLALFDAAMRQADLRTDYCATHSKAAPIFIVGLPRTGTTLVDRILSSHPDVVSAGELNTFAGLVKEATSTTSNRVLDVPTLERASGIDLGRIGNSYVEKTEHLVQGAPRFVDKMPLNFFYAPLIHQALPNAKIVVLRRNAMDTCVSNFRQLFSTGFSYYNYALDILDTADYCCAFETLVQHWETTLPSESLMQISYEDLVCEQESKTRELLAFCNLEWHEGCLRFHENRAAVSTASSVQVRQPLYASSIGRWKKYGSRLDELRERLDRAAQPANSSSGT